MRGRPTHAPYPAILIFADGRTLVKDLPAPLPVYLLPVPPPFVRLFDPESCPFPVHHVREFRRTSGKTGILIYEEA